MLSLLFYSVWIINILHVLFRKQNKLVSIISAIFILIIAGGNTSNGDYLSYFSRYNAKDLSEFEIGFSTIGDFFIRLGLPYNVFIFAIYLISFFVLWICIKKYTKQIHCFYALYFSILLFYDIDQCRNFIAASILTLGLTFLFENKKVPFIACIIAASMFHIISIVYLLLLFIKPENVLGFKYYKLLWVILAVICGGVFIMGNKIPYVSTLIALFSGSDIKANYYGQDVVRFGFIIPFIQQILNIVLVFWSDRKIKMSGMPYNENMLKWTKAIACISVVFFPLIMMDLTFDRILRNFNYMYYIVACMAVESFYINKNIRHTSIKKSELAYMCYLVVYSIVWEFGTVVRYGTYPTEEFLILHNNLFFR